MFFFDFFNTDFYQRRNIAGLKALSSEMDLAESGIYWYGLSGWGAELFTKFPYPVRILQKVHAASYSCWQSWTYFQIALKALTAAFLIIVQRLEMALKPNFNLFPMAQRTF